VAVHDGVVERVDDAAGAVAFEPVDVPLDFAALYAAHHDRLVRLAALLQGSSIAAEDSVQEAFAKLHDRLDRVEAPAAWLTTAVVNASRNQRRHQAVVRRVLPWLARPPVAPDEPVHELVASVRRLPHRQRAVVVLRFYEDLPEAEIASILGVPIGTVKSNLHRALARLRVEVER
jgi:RNA polymerase sigma-70 factor (sigma-E family)